MRIHKYQNIFQHLLYSKLFRLPEWIFQKAKYANHDFSKNVLINMRLGHKLELAATQPYLKRVVINRSYNDEGVFFLKQYLKPGAVIIDIGANIGLLTCAYAKRYQDLKPEIYAIEAVEDNYKLLNKNIEINGFKNVKTFRLALGKNKGEITFKLPFKGFTGNAVGNNILNNEDIESVSKTHFYEEVVPLNTLDAWAQENHIEKCDFIKIDVEGAEIAVFEGGIEFIKKTRPVIQSEFNRYYVESQGMSVNDYVNFFESLNYECYVEDHKYFSRLDPQNFPHHLVDLLFVPKKS